MSLKQRRFRGVADIGAALALSLLAALAALAMPEGSSLRVLLATPILIFCPGYLLLQALIVPARPVMARVLHGIVSVGLSLSVVGLVALAAAAVPGGFKPGVIIALVTLTCVAFAGVAGYRRSHQHEAPVAVASQPGGAKAPGTRRIMPRSLLRGRPRSPAAVVPSPPPASPAVEKPTEGSASAPVNGAAHAEPSTASNTTVTVQQENP